MNVADEQREYWNSSGGDRWIKHEDLFDRFVQPFGDAALKLLNLRPGEHVLDVGCGCGQTLSIISNAVGPTGSTTGIDISAPMVERARQRVPNATVLVGDAAAVQFERTFDALFSRFGVMFFAEPLTAFRHLRALLAPKGRMAFVCWRPLTENPWAEVPVRAVQSALPHAQGWSGSGPGPFSLANRETLTALLRDAGFASTQILPFDHDVELSTSGLDHAATFATTAGPASRLLVGASDEERSQARDAITNALRTYTVGERIALPGATWLVLANVRD